MLDCCPIICLVRIIGSAKKASQYNIFLFSNGTRTLTRKRKQLCQPSCQLRVTRHQVWHPNREDAFNPRTAIAMIYGMKSMSIHGVENISTTMLGTKAPNITKGVKAVENTIAKVSIASTGLLNTAAERATDSI